MPVETCGQSVSGGYMNVMTKELPIIEPKNITAPDSRVDEKEYYRLLGFPPDHRVEGRSKELADWARDWYRHNGNPWVHIHPAGSLIVNGDSFTIDGVSFTSKRVSDQFIAAGANEAVLVAVSAGSECEVMARQLWEEQKPDEYFFLEVFGSAVVEHLITKAGFMICEAGEKRGKAVLPHYSPGYPEWDIADQRLLWNLLNNGSEPTLDKKLTVLDSGMLRPKKSLLAVFGITRQTERVQRLSSLIPCTNCSLSGCQYRRSPYRHYLPAVDNVSTLQVQHGTTQGMPAANAPKYSFSENALRKWSAERLTIKRIDSRSIEALFRYEGSTCSNMGHPLVFEYHISLTQENGTYRIVKAQCIPAAGESGFELMCDFLDRGDEFMKSISDESPLQGKQLIDIFSWRRQFDPSACYCSSVSRDYKWGLVYEVLHYTLHRNENNKS